MPWLLMHYYKLFQIFCILIVQMFTVVQILQIGPLELYQDIYDTSGSVGKWCQAKQEAMRGGNLTMRGGALLLSSQSSASCTGFNTNININTYTCQYQQGFWTLMSFSAPFFDTNININA